MLLNAFIYFLGIFVVVFHYKICFYHFHFFFWWSINFQQQNINILPVSNSQWNCVIALCVKLGVWKCVIYFSFLTLKSPRKSVKKRLFVTIVSIFSSKSSKTDSVNDLKQWNSIIFPRLSFRSWCALVRTKYLLPSMEENFYSR